MSRRKIKIFDLKNPNDKKAISRHEVLCDLEDVIRAASRLVMPRGKFFMIHRPIRLVDIVTLGRKYNLEPKKLRIVQSYTDSKPKLILVKATKNAKSFLNIEEPLIIYNKDGSYTNEIFRIYGKEEI